MPRRSDDKPKSQGPTVRLSVTIEGGKESSPVGEEAMARHLGPKERPSERLALGADLIQSVGPKALGPQVRLVANGKPGREDSKAEALGPTGRLATANENLEVYDGVKYPTAFAPPSIRLAHVPGAQGDNNLLGQRGVEQLPDQSKPALLVSYWYLEPFLENRHRYAYRDWVLDSGAFSADNSGAVIDLDDFTDKALELLASDPTLTEVFALDVIGDWKSSIQNCEYMWKKGVPAIPTFHYGSPWDVLKGIARDYPKIAVGGCVGKRDKDKFAAQCFARVWPARIHGFGFGSEKSVMMFPWHSVDATNWELGPCKYGQWKAFGGQRVSVRGSQQNLRAEVEWYLELERKARVKWKKQMEELEQANGRTIRLASDPASGGGNRIASAIESPTVRLAHKKSGRENGKFDSSES